MIIYKTTNKNNGKIYVGIDTKNNPKYLGSGTILKHAIKKYGKENFYKEILDESMTLTLDEMLNLEVNWINKLDATNPEIGYNIRNSIVYNSSGENYKFTDEHKKKISESRMGVEPWNKGKTLTEGHKSKIGRTGEENGMYENIHTEETKKIISEKMSGENSPRYGTHHTKETKEYLSKCRKGVPLSEKGRKNRRRDDGEHNPMYGKIAIHNETENKMIKKENLESYLINGWKKGRLKINLYSGL